jgi:hypothetical protein
VSDWPSNLPADARIEVYVRDNKVRFCVPLGGVLHVLSALEVAKLRDSLEDALWTGATLQRLIDKGEVKE